MVKCQGCGTENPDKSRFCIGCGKEIPPEVSTAPGCCPACGAEATPGSRFCVGCGKPLPAGGIGIKAVCPSCGAQNDAGSRFCTGCGASLEATRPDAGPGMRGPGAAAGVFQQYLSLLDGKMKQAGFDTIEIPPLLNLERCYRRQKFEISKIGHVTTFCGLQIIDEPAKAAHLKSYSVSVFDYAVRNKGYLARNAFQPLVVYPVILAPGCEADARQFLDSYWPKHWMAYEFPVVVDVVSKTMIFHRSKPLWGFMYHEGIRKDAEALFNPA